jgi:hypothetical protein
MGEEAAGRSCIVLDRLERQHTDDSRNLDDRSLDDRSLDDRSLDWNQWTETQTEEWGEKGKTLLLNSSSQSTRKKAPNFGLFFCSTQCGSDSFNAIKFLLFLLDFMRDKIFFSPNKLLLNASSEQIRDYSSWSLKKLIECHKALSCYWFDTYQYYLSNRIEFCSWIMITILTCVLRIINSARDTVCFTVLGKLNLLIWWLNLKLKTIFVSAPAASKTILAKKWSKSTHK